MTSLTGSTESHSPTSPSQSPKATPLSSAVAKIMRRVIPLFAIMMMCNQLNRSNIGYAESHLEADLGIGATSFYVLRFLLGMAEAGFVPAVLYYLAKWLPNGYQGRSNARYAVGALVAFSISGSLSGPLLGMDGSLGLRGWQWMFLVEGSCRSPSASSPSSVSTPGSRTRAGSPPTRSASSRPPSMRRTRSM
jgi:MFS family permease